MANLSKIRVRGILHNIVDAFARSEAAYAKTKAEEALTNLEAFESEVLERFEKEDGEVLYTYKPEDYPTTNILLSKNVTEYKKIKVVYAEEKEQIVEIDDRVYDIGKEFTYFSIDRYSGGATIYTNLLKLTTNRIQQTLFGSWSMYEQTTGEVIRYNDTRVAVIIEKVIGYKE